MYGPLPQPRDPDRYFRDVMCCYKRALGHGVRRRSVFRCLELDWAGEVPDFRPTARGGSSRASAWAPTRCCSSPCGGSRRRTGRWWSSPPRRLGGGGGLPRSLPRRTQGNQISSCCMLETNQSFERLEMLHLSILCSQLIPSNSCVVTKKSGWVSDGLSRQYTVTAIPSGFDRGT